MQIQFIKMIQFSYQFKAGDRQREFNFRKLNSPVEEKFNVNVSDERGNRIVFSMEKKESGWKIITPQLPEWIIASEANLNRLIEDELSNNGPSSSITRFP